MRTEKKALIASTSVFILSLIFVAFQNCTMGRGFKAKTSSLGSIGDDSNLPPNPNDPPVDPCTGSVATHAQTVVPFIQRYCINCHSNAQAFGGYTIEPLLNEAEARYNDLTWNRMIGSLRSGAMPQGDPKPQSCEIDALEAWKSSVQEVTCAQNAQPGRATLRRHSHWEYDNTIRDLTGLNLNLSQTFVADGGSASFDHVGSVQQMSLPRLESYLEAAIRVSDEIMANPTARSRVVICSQENLDCAKQIIETFGLRAYRRPLTVAESARLADLVTLAKKNGDSFEIGIKLVIQALLVSPNFLYHSVEDYSPTDPGRLYQLNSWEIATRLSYFLWGSMPDSELFSKAQSGALSDPMELRAQIQRMIVSPNFATAMQTGFADQWLQLRQFEAAIPTLNFDSGRYPEFSRQLAQDGLRETRELFRAIAVNDRPPRELLTSNQSYINERLANFYGISGVTGTNFRPVSTASANRYGILSHATTSMMSSTPSNKSIVRRGLFIMSQLACQEPGSPPPDAGNFNPNIDPSLPQRQKLAIHSQNAACYSCHKILDNYGFSMERFNAIGKYVTMEGTYALDSTGVTPDGRNFDGVASFAQKLVEDGSFDKCISQKLITFATGRVPQVSDRCSLNYFAQQADERNLGFHGLLELIGESDLVLKSRAESSALAAIPDVAPPALKGCDLSGKITWDSGAGTKTIADQHWDLATVEECKSSIRNWLDSTGCATGGVNRTTSVIDMPAKFYRTWGRVRGSCNNIPGLVFQ